MYAPTTLAQQYKFAGQDELQAIAMMEKQNILVVSNIGQSQAVSGGLGASWGWILMLDEGFNLMHQETHQGHYDCIVDRPERHRLNHMAAQERMNAYSEQAWTVVDGRRRSTRNEEKVRIYYPFFHLFGKY